MSNNYKSSFISDEYLQEQRIRAEKNCKERLKEIIETYKLEIVEIGSKDEAFHLLLYAFTEYKHPDDMYAFYDSINRMFLETFIGLNCENEEKTFDTLTNKDFAICQASYVICMFMPGFIKRKQNLDSEDLSLLGSLCSCLQFMINNEDWYE